MRPYLWLVLTGPYGGEEILISGLVDTGADRSVLPIDYAQTLGYKVDDLAPAEIKPLFVAGLNALWGRADLMMNFAISVSEKNRELILQPD